MVTWIESLTTFGAAVTFRLNAYQEQHRNQVTARHGLSLSSPSSERFPPPIPSLRTLLSLSHGVVLLHLTIVSLVIASPQIAKAGVEEWPRGKAHRASRFPYSSHPSPHSPVGTPRSHRNMHTLQRCACMCKLLHRRRPLYTGTFCSGRHAAAPVELQRNRRMRRLENP